MKKLTIVLIVVLLLMMAFAVPAFAHNIGHVDTPNGGCADVGSGNHPPEGNAVGNDGHPRGVGHAAHAGNSAVESGSCP